MDPGNNTAAPKATDGEVVPKGDGHEVVASPNSPPPQDNNGINRQGPAKKARKAPVAKKTGPKKARVSTPRAKKRAANSDAEKTSQSYISTDLAQFLEKLRIKNDEITKKQNELKDLQMTAAYLRSVVDTMQAANVVATPSTVAGGLGERDLATSSVTNVDTKGQQGTSAQDANTSNGSGVLVLSPDQNGPKDTNLEEDPTPDEAAENL